MNIAIIPARGGSKRIPKKNIREFCGKPMIAWAIEAAIASNLFDRVVVSTDDAGIANVSRKWGAEVPFMRPADLADDFTGTTAVVLHALEELTQQGVDCDVAYCIYATNPFLQTRYLQQGYELLTRQGAPSVFTVATFPSSIYRSWRITEQGTLEMIWPEYRMTRSQDLPEAYHDAGQFYCSHATTLRREKRFGMSGARPVIIPRYLVHDIDTKEDWARAELIFEAIRRKENSNV